MNAVCLAKLGIIDGHDVGAGLNYMNALRKNIVQIYWLVSRQDLKKRRKLMRKIAGFDLVDILVYGHVLALS